MVEMTVVERLAEIDARKAQGYWIPCSGETPVRYRSGHVLLKCWQPSTGKSAMLNVETDIFLSNDEAVAIMMS